MPCGCFDNRIASIGEPSGGGSTVRTRCHCGDNRASAVLDLEHSTGNLSVVMFFRFRDLDLAHFKVGECDDRTLILRGNNYFLICRVRIRVKIVSCYGRNLMNIVSTVFNV